VRPAVPDVPPLLEEPPAAGVDPPVGEPPVAGFDPPVGEPPVATVDPPVRAPPVPKIVPPIGEPPATDVEPQSENRPLLSALTQRSRAPPVPGAPPVASCPPVACPPVALAPPAPAPPFAAGFPPEIPDAPAPAAWSGVRGRTAGRRTGSRRKNKNRRSAALSEISCCSFGCFPFRSRSDPFSLPKRASTRRPHAMGKATGELPGPVDDATRRLTNRSDATSTQHDSTWETHRRTYSWDGIIRKQRVRPTSGRRTSPRQLMYLAAALVAALVLAPVALAKNQAGLPLQGPPCTAQLPRARP